MYIISGIECISFCYGCNDLSCPNKTVLNGIVTDFIRINATCTIANKVCFYWITYLSTDFINCTVNNGPYINDNVDNSCSMSTRFINTIPYIGLFLIIISLTMLIGFIETYR